MNDTDFGWFVGLFEGEGCFLWDTRTKRATYIQITSTDLDVLERVQSIAGGRISKQYDRPDKPNWKPCWIWHNDIKSGSDLVTRMLPLLMSRRKARAQEWLDSRATVGKTAGRKPTGNKDRIKEMLSTGNSHKEIAEALGVSPSYVSQVKRDLHF